MKLKKITSKALLAIFFISQFSIFQVDSMVYAYDLSSKVSFANESKKVKTLLNSQLGFITSKILLSKEEEIEDEIETEEPPETEIIPDETPKPDEYGLKISMHLETEELEKPIYKGDKFLINVCIDEFINVNREDINSIEINLSYDENILELIKIQGQSEINNDLIYEIEGNKVIIPLDSENMDENIICTMEFNVLEIPENSNQTQVEISALGEFNEEFCILSNSVSIDIEIQKREDQIVVNGESGYIIENDNQDGKIYITRIIPGTTVNSFLNNVLIITDGDIVFTKKVSDEEELTQITISEDDFISTGTTLKIGDKSFVLVVTGDITGSGKITPSDLGGLKLYSIQSQDYTLELPNIKACDINNDGKITPTDIAQLKRVLIGDMEISNTVED